MIIRRYDIIASLGLAQDFQCAVAEHFVHIHIDRCAGTTLNRIDRELIQPFSRQDFIGGLHKAVPIFFGRRPVFMLASAAAFLTSAMAWMKSGSR